MTERTGDRCPAVYMAAARPLLAAVASARVARHPEPHTDWRCVREPHITATGGEHLAMPLGMTGPSLRFDDTMVEPTTEQLADQLLADQAITAAVFGEHVEISTDDASPAPLHQADPDDVRRLIELVDRPGTTAIHVADGAELLLLMPDADTDHQAAAVRALADMFPTVSFLLLSGVTGAVVMPHRKPLTDEYHDAGVYCGEPAHCTPPYPDALPGAAYPPPVRIVDQA